MESTIVWKFRFQYNPEVLHTTNVHTALEICGFSTSQYTRWNDRIEKYTTSVQHSSIYRNEHRINWLPHLIFSTVIPKLLVKLEHPNPTHRKWNSEQSLSF